jgi:hypothetical protein
MKGITGASPHHKNKKRHQRGQDNSESKLHNGSPHKSIPNHFPILEILAWLEGWGKQFKLFASDIEVWLTCVYGGFILQSVSKF